MKKYTILIILSTLLFACNSSNNNNTSSTSQGILDSNTQVFDPSSSFEKESISESSSSSIKEFSLAGTYVGEDYNGDIINLQIFEDKHIKLEHISLNVIYNFIYECEENNYYTFKTEDTKNTLVVYQFGDLKKLSVTLNDGVFQDNMVWINDIEFIKKED